MTRIRNLSRSISGSFSSHKALNNTRIAMYPSEATAQAEVFGSDKSSVLYISDFRIGNRTSDKTENSGV